MGKLISLLFLIALLSCFVSCKAFMRTLRAGEFDPNARSVPLAPKAQVQKIISRFKENMAVQLAKRAPLDCGVFHVEFVTEPNDDFKTAVCYALREILSGKLDMDFYGSNKIFVSADFTNLPNGVLGSAGPENLCKDGALYYPSSYLQLSNPLSTCVPPGTSSLVMQFNTQANWYLGLDGDGPTDQFDFVTVVSHEVIHGMGFVSAIEFTPNLGTVTGATYDLDALYFIDTLFDPPLDNSSSPNLLAWATGDLEYTFQNFQGTTNAYPNQGAYSPNTVERGSSVSHWDFTIQDDPPETCQELNFDLCNGLMRPSLSNGLSIHRMGGNVLNAFSNMGYRIFDCRDLTDKDSCLGDDDTDGPRCDWCRTDDFCTDITLVDDIWEQSCKDFDYAFAEEGRLEEDSSSSLESFI